MDVVRDSEEVLARGDCLLLDLGLTVCELLRFLALVVGLL
jgi:hypothetical protein